MNTVIIYTHDLIEGREHLIPWKTLIELSKILINKGFKVIIFSGIKNYTASDYIFEGILIKFAPKPSQLLIDLIKSENPSMLFWPVTWFANVKSLNTLNKINAKKIVYFPGGVYKLSYIFRSLKYVPFRILLPYIIESVFPKRITTSVFKKIKIRHIVTFTQFTADYLIRNGWNANNLSVIYPVFNSKENITDESLYNQYNLGKKYFLYMGSSSPIRGFSFIIEAIFKNPDILNNHKFVFLIRNDRGVKRFEPEEKYRHLMSHKNLVFINETLSHHQLIPFIKHSYAILLPFLIVPSEVPITFYEVLNSYKPVITFDNAGTTDHLKSCIYISPARKKDFIKTIQNSASDIVIFKNKIENIRENFIDIYNWDSFNNRIKLFLDKL